MGVEEVPLKATYKKIEETGLFNIDYYDEGVFYLKNTNYILIRRPQTMYWTHSQFMGARLDFELVFEYVPPEIQEKLLFHLDIFRVS